MLQGSCSRKKENKHINAEIIKILSDSLFIFWGEYTSAGKQSTCTGKAEVATTHPTPTPHPRPFKHRRRAHESTSGKSATSGRCGLCRATSAWPNAPRGILSVQTENCLRRKTSSCSCPGHASRLQLGENSVSEDLAEVLGGNCSQSSLSLWLKSMK